VLLATGGMKPCITRRRTGMIARTFLRLRVVVVSVVLLLSPISSGESYGDRYGLRCRHACTMIRSKTMTHVHAHGYNLYPPASLPCKGEGQVLLPKQRKMKIGKTVLRFFSRVALLSRPEACQLWSGVAAAGAGVIVCGDVSCYRWGEHGLSALAQCLTISNVKFAQTFAFVFRIPCWR